MTSRQHAVHSIAVLHSRHVARRAAQQHCKATVMACRDQVASLPQLCADTMPCMLPLTWPTGQAVKEDSTSSCIGLAQPSCAAGASPLQQPYMIGAPAPHYQPSLLPKGRVMALQIDRGLQPSPLEALDDVLRDLKMDRRTLEVTSVNKSMPSFADAV